MLRRPGPIKENVVRNRLYVLNDCNPDSKNFGKTYKLEKDISIESGYGNIIFDLLVKACPYFTKKLAKLFAKQYEEEVLDSYEENLSYEFDDEEVEMFSLLEVSNFPNAEFIFKLDASSTEVYELLIKDLNNPLARKKNWKYIIINKYCFTEASGSEVIMGNSRNVEKVDEFIIIG